MGVSPISNSDEAGERICTKCGDLRPLADFHAYSKGLGGRKMRCKFCCSVYAREWRQANLDRKRQMDKDYAARPGVRERMLQKKADYRARPESKKRQREWFRERRLNNLSFKIAQTLRGRLSKILRRGDKLSGSGVQDLGCTVDELKAHLETQFQPGMTWENWSATGWHIDHIRPLASFDLTDREQFLQACHYTNLQPLWADENIQKGASLDWAPRKVA